MAKKNHTLKVWIILGISVALMLFIFILVAHHRSTADRIRLDRSALLSSAATAAAQSQRATGLPGKLRCVPRRRYCGCTKDGR
jgi:hypothetical protein